MEQVRVEEDPAAESARLRNFVASVIGAQPAPARTAGELLLDVGSRTRGELEPLLQPLGVTSPQVRAVSLQEGNLLTVEVAGAGSRPLERDALAVAAAALGRGNGSRIQLGVSLRLLPPPATPPADLIAFTPRSSIPERAALARARDWLGPWDKRDDLVLSLAAAPGASDALNARRLAELRRRLPRKAEGLPELDPSLPADTWQLRVRQELKVGGEPPAAPAAAGATAGALAASPATPK